MIVIKVELHSARTGKVTTLGQAILANLGSSRDPRKGDYRLSIGRKHSASYGDVMSRPVRTSVISGFPRMSKTIWQLILTALMAAYPGDRKEYDGTLVSADDTVIENIGDH